MTAPQPYYTAADGVSQVATTGPVDPTASFRAKAYAAVSVLLALLGLGVAAFGLSKGIADGGAQILQGVLTLLGAGAPAVAAAKTSTQVANGTFNAAPVVPVADMFKQLADLQTTAAAANDVIKQGIDDTIAHATTQVTQATAQLGAAASMIPAVGTFTNAVLPGAVGDLIQHFADHGAGIVAPATSSTP